MKTKILSLISLSILSLVLLASMASATLTLEKISQPTTANHNSDVVVNFNLTATSDSYSNLDWSTTTSGWTISPTTTSINEGETKILTATYHVPQYSSTSITSAQIGVSDTDSDTLTIEDITINTDKSLSLTSSTISETQNSTTLTLTNDGNVNLSNVVITASGDFVVEISGDVDSSDKIDSIPKGTTKSITITRTSSLSGVGLQSVTITATADGGTTTTGKVSSETPYCGLTKNLENIDITIKDINVKQGFGDDEDYWYPFDVVEIELEISNEGNYDMEDIEVAWALYASNGKKITDDEESDFKLDSDDDKTIIITIRLDDNIDDLENVDEVVFYARAKGKIDDKDSSNDGESTCEEDSQRIDLITDDDFVVLGDFEINGMSLVDSELKESVACGSELQLIADVWNIGDSDQDEVMVLIRNTELGISKKVTIGDIDSFDYEKLEALLEIPENAEAKYYTLEFLIYDEDSDLFETSEDDKAIFKVLIKVDGNCKVADSTKVTASLVTASPKAGEQLTVKTTITNTGDNIATYILNVADYSSWATLEDFEKSLTLVAGEQRDVELTFNVKDDVSGTKVFNIEVIEGTTVTKQPVQVTIEAQKSLFGNVSLPENKYLWIIGAVNVLLIFAIIFVAIRLSRN
jgi:hypothetical protein